MLLIDGARYELWTPSSEEKLEEIVKEHASEIFGQDSVYINLKHKLKSEAGIGSIPDGFVLILASKPYWYIVEIELSSHDVYSHIVPQINKFIIGHKNPISQKSLIDIIYDEITKNPMLLGKVKNTITSEIYRSLTSIVSQTPKLAVVIEEVTDELNEAVSGLKIDPDIVKFQTFRNTVDESIHAHIFAPVVNTIPTPTPKPRSPFPGNTTIKDLVKSGYLKDGQTIYRTYLDINYKGKILTDGAIEINGVKYPSLNMASQAIIKRPTGTENAWISWKTIREDGSECLLNVLRKEYRKQFST